MYQFLHGLTFNIVQITLQEMYIYMSGKSYFVIILAIHDEIHFACVLVKKCMEIISPGQQWIQSRVLALCRFREIWWFKADFHIIWKINMHTTYLQEFQYVFTRYLCHQSSRNNEISWEFLLWALKKCINFRRILRYMYHMYLDWDVAVDAVDIFRILSEFS